MFKIGPFSRVALVPISQLRYYDEVGLFKPAHVDPGSGYRYYTIEQLPVLHRILALKELGLTLQQIKHLIEDNITSEEIHGMLRLKKAQIEQTLEAEQMRLNHVQARLRHLEEHGILSGHDVVLKSVAAQPYLAGRDIMPTLTEMGEYYYELARWLAENAVSYQSWLAVFHDPSKKENDIDWELGVTMPSVTTGSLKGNHRELRFRELEPLEMVAAVIHDGPWLELGLGYQALGQWMAINGYQLVAPAREVYLKLVAPHQPENPIVEIQFPVEKQK
ncbi:MAG: MerR family transcriptional regulator [Chloroflexi bacterium]|nr:MerR family transcriptional regulator [Chloroflexota bacterium]